MHALDILGDPARRRILELLADGEQPAGDLVRVLGRERGISQSAVSQHLKVLRDGGFAKARVDGQRRIYAVDSGALKDVDAWLSRFRRFWDVRLEALDLEVRRGKKQRAKRR